MKGWVKDYRIDESHWVHPLIEGRDFTKYEAWKDLVKMVNHKDGKFMLGTQLVEVKRGSKVTSLRKLSERWKWSKNRVDNFLKLLQQDNMITVHSQHGKRTLIEIVNYDKWQGKGDDEDAETDNQKDSCGTVAGQLQDSQGTVEGQQRTINKNVKNVKEFIDTLFNHWNTLNIVTHRKRTPFMESQLKWKFKDYSVDDLRFSMTEYAAILFDDEYVLSTKWGLDDFLEKGHFEKFLPDRDARGYYPKVKKGNPQPDKQQPEFKPNRQMTDEEAWKYAKENGML